MQLTLFERVILSKIVPAMPGSIMMIRATDKFKHDIALTQREIRKYKVHQEGSKLIWKSTANGKTKNVFIPETIKETVVASLTQLDREEKLMPEHASLWDKFIGE